MQKIVHVCANKDAIAQNTECRPYGFVCVSERAQKCKDSITLQGDPAVSFIKRNSNVEETAGTLAGLEQQVRRSDISQETKDTYFYPAIDRVIKELRGAKTLRNSRYSEIVRRYK